LWISLIGQNKEVTKISSQFVKALKSSQTSALRAVMVRIPSRCPAFESKSREKLSYAIVLFLSGTAGTCWNSISNSIISFP
jgi:hypothetical protein